MSANTNSQPEPEVPFRTGILNAFKEASEKAKAAEAESQAAPVAEEDPEPEPAEALPEPEPVAEPEEEAEQPVAAVPAAPKAGRGRPNVESRIRNLQSIQDKRFNDLMAVVQQQSAQIEQLKSALTPSHPAAPMEEEDDLDPERVAEFERYMSRKGLTPERIRKIAINDEVQKYRGYRPDYAAMEPAIRPFVSRLAALNIPIDAQTLVAIHDSSMELLNGLHEAIYGGNGRGPVQPEAATNVRTPTTRDRQLTPDAAAALKTQTQSMRQESGANVAGDVLPVPKDAREAVLMAMRQLARK